MMVNRLNLPTKKLNSKETFTLLRETTRIRLTKPTFLQKATIAYQLLLTEDTSLLRSSIDVLMMICKDKAVREFIDHQKMITDDGICEEDIFPISVIDIAEEDLQAIAKHLTATAYQKVHQLVRNKQLAWQCKSCGSSKSKHNMIACDACDQWDCVAIKMEPAYDWYCPQCCLDNK